MKKAAMNRKKRLDAPSKQELRERYESARRNAKEDAKEDLSTTSELPKRPREDSDQNNQAQSSDLRDKIPKLSRTIAGNDETGSLVVNVGKTDPSASLSLVDPSYDDNRISVEMFDYSHKRSDTDPVGDDGDDLRSLIERQRKIDALTKKDDKNSKKSGSTFFDSMVGYGKEDHSKSKTPDNYRDSKRKEGKDGKSSSSKSDRHSKHDVKSKSKKGKGESQSSYELGFPFFSGDSGSKNAKNAKNPDKPAEEMDISETLKELAYLRSIQTGDNALPKEEEEYFRKLNDLSNPILTNQFDGTGTEQGKHKKLSSEKADAVKKLLGENLRKIASRWDSEIDSMVGTKKLGNADGNDEATYGPSLPPKKSSVMPKKVQDSSSLERKYSKEKSSSKSEENSSTLSVRGMRGGRGFRGRGVRGSFRGRGGFRGRGRGRGENEFTPGIRGRGRGRSRGRFIRGGFVPTRGRHIFNKEGSSRRRRSRSRSSSRSSSSSRSRSRSRSRGRSSNKRRRRSSSRSSYSSSSYSRSRSRSRDRGKGRKQTKRRSRSKSYSSRSRSRSRSHSRSISSRSRKRSRSRSRSKGSYKKQSKDRARSRSKSSSRSRSRKRKDRSRSWSFDEDYTKKSNAKSTSNTRGTKAADSKAKTKKEQEPKIQSKPKKEKTDTEKVKAKNNKVREPKLEQSDQGKGKTPVRTPENATKKTHDKPKVENSSSPATVALKDLKVTAFSNVFLPRTVSKSAGNISKGIPMGKGRFQPLKKHPVFDTQEEELQEEPEKIDPKELERMKEEKHKFDNEIDKVFNAKSETKDVDKKRGAWKRFGAPEESPKKEEILEKQEQKKLEEPRHIEVEEKKVVEDQRIVESKDITEEKKADKDQRKEKKEKRRKEKEEKSKRRKEKKEKKDKKNKESTNQENLGNEKQEKVLGDERQALLDSSKVDQLEQYNQERYPGYNETGQEYPGGEYQYYEDTAQEQGWYDENGVYHGSQEEEYLYYYDPQGNIVGYEGPEGYVEGNPFEEQQYYYEGEAQEGVHPEVYEQEAYGTEYPGDAGGNYQYRATDFPVEVQGQVQGQGQGEQYMGADNHWEQYPADAPEQQWYGAEGSYPDVGEGYTEYQYAEGAAIEQQDPGQQDVNFMVQQGESLAGRDLTEPQAYVAPVQVTEEPKPEGDISESEIVLALGKNLAALARLKGWNQQELLDKDPVNLVQMLQKPPAEKPAATAQREIIPEEPLRQYQQEEPIRQFPQERKLDELPRQQLQQRKPDEARMQYIQERKPGIAEQKPLKSILKKASSASLKPPSKTETSAASPLTKSDPSTASNDHVGPEYIVRISKSGPERFFCKLCQCHIESTMAKELHVKSMKHIELFVREKTSLLHSVIGAKQSEETVLPESVGSGFSEQDKLQEDREASPHAGTDKADDYESRDNTEEELARNRLLDYERLRLRDWQRREESVSSVESDKPKQFDYGRTDEQDFESRPSSDVIQGTVEQERYDDGHEHSRWPRVERHEADWRKDEQGYGRERQRYPPESRERDYEKGDYHRERRSLSHDSDRRDDRGSVGSRSSDRSIDGSEKDSRLDKAQPMGYRSRMQQDARSSPRDRPGINQGDSSNNQGRERARGATHREQPSRQEQISRRDRSDKSRQTSNQDDRERSSGDGGGQGRGRTSFPPPEIRGQAQQERWHEQGSQQDDTRQDSNPKAKETSSQSTGSSRIPSSDRKKMPGAETAGLGRERSDQNVKPSERISQSIPVVERNQQSQKTSKDSDSNRNTSTGLEDDRESSQKAVERLPGRGGIQPLPRMQNQTEAQEGKRRTQEPQQQVPVSTNVRPPSAALLGDPPRSHKEVQTPQEQAQSISTVVQGQRRVPPPPPPYSKGSGPQSFRGRGHPPPPGGRGGHHSRMPPNQLGMMRGSAAPPHSLLSMQPQVPSHEVGAPSSVMPPRKHFPVDQSMGDHRTPPYYGRGRAAGQPQFRGRGGSPHTSRGGYGGPPQFASRGRGSRGRGGRGGYRGQQW